MKPLESSHILAKIIAAKRQRLDRSKQRVPEPIVKHMASQAAPAPSFKDALQNSKTVRIIAEVKKASPSKGVFSSTFSVADLARTYSESGASAISVVTEEDFFQGNLGWIDEIRRLTTLPVLRKDFVYDPYQVYETRAAKASAILLIAAMLQPEELRKFVALSRDVGLDALVEVHDETELGEALEAGAEIIGVNNRNLKTFDVDIETSRRLGRLIPDSCLFVVESGIRNRDDISSLTESGADAFLIGETLIAAASPAETLKGLL